MEFNVIGNDTRRFKCSVRRVHETLYDQRYEPICYACALATAITITYRIKHGILLDFSPQSLINNHVRTYDRAREHLVEKGLFEHCDDPFIHIECSPRVNQKGHRYTLVDFKYIDDPEEMKKVIKYNFGPWGPKYALVADVDTSSFTDEEAVDAWNGEPLRLGPLVELDKTGHGVVITGLDASSFYDDQHALELKNSYGKGFGKDGYTKIAYDCIQSLEIPVMLGDFEDMEKHHHPLQLSTLIGDDKLVVGTTFSHENSVWHPILINGICFSEDGNLLAAACDDGPVRIFYLADASSRSFKCTTHRMPDDHGTFQTAVAVAFANNGSSLVVACKSLASSGTFINTFDSNDGDAGLKFNIMCTSYEGHLDHNLVSLYASKAHGDDVIIQAASPNGTDIWGGNLTSKEKLQSFGNLAIISPDGRYIAAATSAHAIKVSVIETDDTPAKYVKRRNRPENQKDDIKDKNRALKHVTYHSLLKGHKDAITCMCFTPDMNIITVSLDGTLRVWNTEGPDAINQITAFGAPRHDSKETQRHYDCVSVSPDGDIVAVSEGKVLQWCSFETFEVIDTAEHAHEGIIRSITWAPKPLCVGDSHINVLATVGDDKKLKLWKAPTLPKKSQT